MSPKYDIFKKTDNSAVWVEAVEDIVAAKKRLISLSTSAPGVFLKMSYLKLTDTSRKEMCGDAED